MMDRSADDNLLGMSLSCFRDRLTPTGHLTSSQELAEKYFATLSIFDPEVAFAEPRRT
jgi:hypothetical protein